MLYILANTMTKAIAPYATARSSKAEELADSGDLGETAARSSEGEAQGEGHLKRRRRQRK